MSKVIIHTDGGVRGNPGPAAIGVVLEREGEPTIKVEEYIGETTNNQAEYLAVLRAFEELSKLPEVVGAEFYLDSELVVKQINGQYKVKNGDLKSHHEAIAAQLAGLGYPVTFTHVRREKNQVADSLVNAALDAL